MTFSANTRIVSYSDRDAKKLFAKSLMTEGGTGFTLLRIANGELGIFTQQIAKMVEENIAWLNRPFDEKMQSIFLNDPYKDAGWFPVGAEGRTGGPANLLEYTHHRPDRRGIDFNGHTFLNTWGVFKGIYRLVMVLTNWLAEEMPDNHPAKERMHSLVTQVDYEKRSVFRFLRYYPEHPFLRNPDNSPILPYFDEKEGVWIWNDPHEDVAWLTIIPTQTDKGLQLLGNDAVYHDLPHIPPEKRNSNEIILAINGGDSLSMASGGLAALCQSIELPDGTRDKFYDPLILEHLREPERVAKQWRKGYYHVDRKLRVIKQGFYQSTTHRVIMPKGTKKIRHSTPFFFHPVGWANLCGPWDADDKMVGYVRNKEAQRDASMRRILEQNNR